MVVWGAFTKGLRRVWENKVLGVILYLFKLLFSFFLLLPAYFMFSKTFSMLPASENFLNGYDFSLLVDFFVDWGKGLGLYQMLFFFILLTCGLAYVFLSGGLWGGLLQNLKEGRKRFALEKFSGDCGKHFWSFLKIFILTCAGYLLVFILGMMIVSLLSKIVGNELSVSGHYIFFLGGFIVFAVLFLWVDMWGDYLRIYRISFEESKVRTILFPSLRFIFRNFGTALSLYYLLTIFLLGTVAVYLLLNKALHLQGATGLMVLSVFIWQQFYSLFRSFFRLGYYSAQLELFDKLYSAG